jgi:colanic acid/amylovoran biosynthesis glycosyltransferase
VLHAHFAPNGLKAVFFRENRLLTGRLVTSFHGYDVNTYPLLYGRNVYRHLFRHGDTYTANTEFTRERAIALGCPAERIHVLPEVMKASPCPFAERSARPGERVRLLSVGGLVEVKGVEFGLRAVARLAGDHPLVHYDIVGEGPLRQRLESLAGGLGIRERVTFHGGLPQDRLRGVYAAAHVFLLPGVIARNGAQEGQGRVLMEAQAAGLPVVASRVGGIPETMADGRSGFLVPPRDVDALARRLRDLLAHPETWPALGRAGRTFVQDRFDPRRLTDRLLRLYRADPEEVGSPSPYPP